MQNQTSCCWGWRFEKRKRRVPSEPLAGSAKVRFKLNANDEGLISQIIKMQFYFILSIVFSLFKHKKKVDYEV